ncbi:hypothetical protein, partial [Serratia marcescens]|uniref:hypothetical protein n=1 Tax=Serratia marcescens TaxID=615 RepID=UPI0013DB3E42
MADMVDGMRWAAGLTVPGAPVNPNPAKILVVGFASGFDKSGKIISCDTADSDPNVAAAASLYADAITE